MKYLSRLCLCVAAVVTPHSIAAPVASQSAYNCLPGTNCTALSWTATTTTGTGVILSGDAGVQFGDGTIQATATTVAIASGYGAFASRPAAGTAGKMYYCTDCPVAVWVDTGSAWAPLVGGQALGTQPKASSNFSSYNRAGGSTPVIADRNGALHLTLSDSTGTKNAGFTEALSSSTMHVEAAIVINYDGPVAVPTASAADNACVVMRESSSGKLATFAMSIASITTSFTGSVLSAAYWSAPQTNTSNIDYANPSSISGTPILIRLERSGSNILWRVSTDAGANYTTYRTVATSTVFTTAPDQVGICEALGNASGAAISADFVSYNSGS